MTDRLNRSRLHRARPEGRLFPVLHHLSPPTSHLVPPRPRWLPTDPRQAHAAYPILPLLSHCSSLTWITSSTDQMSLVTAHFVHTEAFSTRSSGCSGCRLWLQALSHAVRAPSVQCSGTRPAGPISLHPNHLCMSVLSVQHCLRAATVLIFSRTPKFFTDLPYRQSLEICHVIC